MTINLEVTKDGKLRVSIEGVCNVVVDRPPVVVLQSTGQAVELAPRRVVNKIEGT